MAVTFVKRGGRVVGITALGSEIRWAFRALVGRKYNDRTPADGEFMMANFTEQQIRDAVATYDREVYLASSEY